MGNINIIVAASENNCIGINGDLPWNLPTDLKRFKELTLNHVVIMGRKCYESIPAKFRPLPNRTNVIITRNTEYVAEGCEVRHDLASAIAEYGRENSDIFIIGGSEIYKESFASATQLYLTRVMAHVDGDVFLEGLNPEDWVINEFDGPYEENEFTYRFDKYVRKSN